MPISVEDLSREVEAIQKESGELKRMLLYETDKLAAKENAIAAITRGSRSGHEAVLAVGQAVEALRSSAIALASLEGVCESCREHLRG